MIPGSANPLLLASAAAGGYQVQRSLRFNSSDSGFCSRTPAVAGNRRTWTWAGWVKRSYLNSSGATYQQLFTAGSSNGVRDVFFFDTDTDDTLAFYSIGSGFGNSLLLFRTNAVFRDVSAWYHIVLAVDTTQATAANRIRLYVNGVEQTFSTVNYPSQNSDGLINSVIGHGIGRDQGQANQYFDGYLAECYLIDGQQLTPSSFTEVSATTGQLIPKAYSGGSYGTNGFYLQFADNSSNTAATLGKDTSGNSNNWTPNNLSVTAGAGNDSLVDTPTSFGTDTGVGNEVRGNYATWNPLSQVSSSLVNGNLDATVTAAVSAKALGTIFFQTGKWYWEVTYVSTTYSSAAAYQAGVATDKLSTSDPYSSPYGWTYTDGLKYHNGSGTAMTGATITNGDVVMFAVDADAGKIWFGKNGTWFESGSPATGTNPQFTTTANQNFTCVCGSGANNCTYYLNTGQRAFAYNNNRTGFKALCDTNLGAPLVAKPNTVMDVVLWTGNVTARTISGLNFSPDLVWIKNRTTASSHTLYDTIRGATKILVPNGTGDELTLTNFLTAFTSDGFSIGTDNNLNGSGNGIVGWAWDAGTSTVSNTAGSITSQVRANVSAGFSVVTYTGTGANATVGHGLGVAPSLIICKVRNTSDNWCVYHASIGASLRLNLNTTAGTTSGTNAWGTTPTSTVFSIGTSGEVNTNANTFVAYCFSPVVGYSSFGSYTGNGSADGPFVYTGFRPRWIMIKNTTAGATYWWIYDTARDTYNATGLYLFANVADSEADYRSVYPIDILSNGFKVRNTLVAASSNVFIYMAFAENPFQYARAR